MECVPEPANENMRGNKKSFRYVMNCLVLMILMTVALLVNKSLSTPILILLFAIIVFQGIDLKVQSILLLLPFQSTLIIGGNISLFVIIQFIVLLALLIEIKKMNLKYVLPIMGFGVMQLFSVILYDAEIKQIITIVIAFMLMCMLCEHFANREEDCFSIYAKSIIVGVITASSVAVWPNLGMLLDGLYIPRFAGLWTNPNILGMQLMVAAAIAVALLAERKMAKKFGIPILALLGFFALLTESRSALYAISLIALLSILMEFKYNRFEVARNLLIRKVAAITLICVMTLLAYNYIMKPVIEARGMIYTTQDITHGRVSLLLSDYRWVMDHEKGLPLLIGLGMENNVPYMESKGFITSGTHNTWAEMLLSAGFFGFAFWLIFLYNALNRGFRPLLRYRMFFVYVLLLYSFVAHLNTSDFMYFSLTLIMIAESEFIRPRLGEGL